MSSAALTSAHASALKTLHVHGSPLILANIWDLASLNALLSLNTGDSRSVKAVATASWAIAAALGIADEDLTLEQNLAVARALAPVCARAGLPLTVDLQDGYGDAVGSVVRQAVEAGAAGANIEDSVPAAGFGRGFAGSLYGAGEQVRRLKTALAAAKDAGCPEFVVNARCDVFRLDDAPGLSDEARMAEGVARGRAYLAAGATTVFYWGGGARGMAAAEVETLVRELGGRVAVKLGAGPEALSTAELAAMQVARISVGPSLFQAAMGAVKQSALTILGGGRL